jgi:hypothetical protein
VVVKRLAPDVLLALLVFLAAAWWGATYAGASLAAGREPRFYQEYFEPALMLACGRGFVVTIPEPIPAATAFLQRQTDAFSCADLPAGLHVGNEPAYQYVWYYLMLSVAVTWMFTGVAWSALPPLLGVLFGVSVASVYAMCRYGMGRVLAVICATAVALSTAHLLNLPHLRDYSKAPFALLSIVVLGALVTRPLSWRTTPVLGALYGAILGFGYGFRTDLLAGLPALVIVVALFVPGGVTTNLAMKGAAVVAFGVAFVVCAWPTLNYVVNKGGCQWHVALLGFAPSFDSDLGVTTPVYQWGHSYSDSYLFAAVSAYAGRQMPELGRLHFCTPDYDRASARYLRDVVVASPADMVTRAYASALRITDLPFQWYGAPLEGLASWVYRVRSALLRVLAGYGWVPVLLALCVTGAANLRLGFFLLFVLLYFGGYPALQFQNRHYFHLEFIGWWSAGFLVQRAADVARHRPQFAGLTANAAKSLWARRFVIFAAISVAALWLPLWTLRAYQHRTMERVIQTMIAAPRRDVATPAVSPDDPRQFQYLDIELEPSLCGAGGSLSLAYDPAHPDLGRVIPVAIDARVARHVVAPVFWHFRAVEMQNAGTGCVRTIRQFDLPPGIPALPTLVLPDDWDTLPLHQSLR